MDSLILRLTEGLRRHADVEAFLLFGSVSRQQADKYSDLDFLVIVNESAISRYIADLDWLNQCAKIIVYAREGTDSFKVLFEDGIVGDFGVVTPKHFGEYPHEIGVVVFQKENVDLSLSNRKILPTTHSQEEWLNHFLFNLYLGLGRYLRGEIMNAHTLIEGNALNAFLNLIKVSSESYDPYQIDRHFESIHPNHDIDFNDYFGNLCDLPLTAQKMMHKIQSLYPIDPEFEDRINQRLKECETVR